MTENKQPNQYISDPRQKLCRDYYLNPKSDTFANATKSAIKAGYTETSADNITTMEWFKKMIQHLRMLDKAERNLENNLDMNTAVVKEIGGEQVAIIDPQLEKIKQTASIFIAKTVGKETYSERQELTGQNGDSLIIKFDNSFEEDETDLS